MKIKCKTCVRYKDCPLSNKIFCIKNERLLWRPQNGVCYHCKYSYLNAKTGKINCNKRYGQCIKREGYEEIG